LKKKLFIFWFLLLAVGVSTEVYCQGQEKMVSFTGIIVGGQNSAPLKGAFIINATSGRGATSNSNGYFLIQVYPGDSILFSHVGFRKQFYKIPKKTDVSYSAVVDLKEDVQMLAEVKVYPFATEELFKKAFIEYRLPDQREREALANATSERSLAMLAASSGMGASANFRNYMETQAAAKTNQNFFNTSILNPMAWASLIQSVKNGDLTDKRWKGIKDVQINENISREKFIKKTGK
jgi:hypothetical protein